jgi:hypothetical protein
MASRKRKRPIRYGWALRFDAHSPEYPDLSWAAREGLGYAQRIAEDARERATEALTNHANMMARTTVKNLAADHGVSPIEINRQIKQARIELFGKDLSESAIYYRLKHLEPHRGRTCAEPDCTQPIRAQEPISRLYCPKHAQPKYRTRRTRLRQANLTGKKAPLADPATCVSPSESDVSVKSEGANL